MTDFYNIYAGQDGDVDYETPVAVMALDDTQVQVPDQDLPPNTVWHYVRRWARGDGCELEGPSSDPCIIFIDENGDMRPAAPNPPSDLTAEPIAGGKIRLRWHYGHAAQEVAPTGFNIYIDGELADTVDYNGQASYVWTSDALVDGQQYRLVVRSFVTDGGESQNADYILATADDAGPPAITDIAASWEAE